MPAATDEPPRARLRTTRAERQRIGTEIAARHDEVAHRADLRAAASRARTSAQRWRRDAGASQDATPS